MSLIPFWRSRKEKNTSFKISQLNSLTNLITLIENIGEFSGLSNLKLCNENAGAAGTASCVKSSLKARRFLMGHTMIDMARASEVAQ